MDLSAAQALDYLTWTNTESVRAERTRRGSPLADAVPVAKRRALRQRELAASGGVYTGLDRVFLVPAAVLAPGWLFEPADVLVTLPPAADAGTRYTVLEAQSGKRDQTWRLTCRNLALSTLLQDLVTVERAALSQDAAGAFVKRFPSETNGSFGTNLYANLPARVQLLRNEVVDQRGVRAFVGRCAVIVGAQVAVTSEDRVLWSDTLGVAGPAQTAADAPRVLDIVGVHNARRIDELTVLDCELRP